MQQHSPENGFECRSGCIAPEACINALQIRALNVARRGLSATLEDRPTVDTIKAVHGGLSSIQTRSDHIAIQHAALYDSCGLYQLQADELTTEAVPVEQIAEAEHVMSLVARRVICRPAPLAYAPCPLSRKLTG